MPESGSDISGNDVQVLSSNSDFSKNTQELAI